MVLGIDEPFSFLKNSKNLLSVLHVYVYVVTFWKIKEQAIWSLSPEN